MRQFPYIPAITYPDPLAFIGDARSVVRNDPTGSSSYIDAVVSTVSAAIQANPDGYLVRGIVADEFDFDVLAMLERLRANIYASGVFDFEAFRAAVEFVDESGIVGRNDHGLVARAFRWPDELASVSAIRDREARLASERLGDVADRIAESSGVAETMRDLLDDVLDQVDDLDDLGAEDYLDHLGDDQLSFDDEVEPFWDDVVDPDPTPAHGLARPDVDFTTW